MDNVLASSDLGWCRIFKYPRISKYPRFPKFMSSRSEFMARSTKRGEVFGKDIEVVSWRSR